MRMFESLFAAMHETCDPSRQKYLGVYFETGSGAKAPGRSLFILGHYLATRPRTILFGLASSKDFVRRRIAIIATAAFIRAGDLADTLRIAEVLLHDQHQLIHRAVGWMLREVGKRSPVAAERFLERHAHAMPRLMLRYALERLPESRRKRYLDKSR